MRSPALAFEPRLLYMPPVYRPGFELINALSPPPCWDPLKAGTPEPSHLELQVFSTIPAMTMCLGHIWLNKMLAVIRHRDLDGPHRSSVQCLLSLSFSVPWTQSFLLPSLIPGPSKSCHTSLGRGSQTREKQTN